jgi:hypothetical protein
VELGKAVRLGPELAARSRVEPAKRFRLDPLLGIVLPGPRDPAMFSSALASPTLHARQLPVRERL